MDPMINKFRGLNNVTDPLRLGAEWSVLADNVDFTGDGTFARRDGFSRAVTGTFSGAYSARNFSALYVVEGGVLKRVLPDLTMVALKALASTAQMYWDEINTQVYFTNGTDSGIITQDDEVLDWEWVIPDTPDLGAITGNCAAGQYAVSCTFMLPDGRETGAGAAAYIDLPDNSALLIENIPQEPGCVTNVYISPANSTVAGFAFATTKPTQTWNGAPDSLGAELTDTLLEPLPAGATHVTFWRGRAYVMTYMADADTTIVWFSEPLGFHLFNPGSSYFALPGKGTMLVAHEDALLVGSDSAIHAYDGERLTQLADYGVVPGYGAVEDEDTGKVLFWTVRGLCEALPFSNLTLRQISVECGLSAGAAIIRQNGAKRYVVALQKGGTAFNKRS